MEWLYQCFAAILTIWILYRLARRKRLPPGPPSIPLLGCGPFVPSKPGVKLFTSDEMFKKYGNIIRFDTGIRKIFYVLNDFHQVKSLFSRDNLSSRPTEYYHKHVRGTNGLVRGIVHQSGAVWQEQRRFALTTLRDFGFGKKGIDGIIQEEAELLIRSFLDESARSKGTISMSGQNLNVAVVNVLWQMVASKRFDPGARETVEILDIVFERFSTSPFSVTAFFPALKRFLPASESDKGLFKIYDFMRRQIEEHEANLDEDAPPRDFMDVYLAKIRKHSKRTSSSFCVDQLVAICYDFFLAGAETSSTTLAWAILFMTLHPEVQERVAQEIISHLGSRLPGQDDRAKLPYTNATILEIQRLSYTAPASLQHYATEDIEVTAGGKQCTIPRGAIVICNIRKFLLDPDTFKEPTKFSPERFLNPDGSLVKYEQFTPFGIGKRICLGESLAKSSIFIFFTMMMQNIKFEVDPAKPRPNPEDTIMATTHMLKPFYVKVSQRK